MRGVASDMDVMALARFGLGGRNGDLADGFARVREEAVKGRIAKPGGGRLPATPDLLAELWAAEAAAKKTPDVTATPPAILQHFLQDVDARFNGTMLEADTGFGERLVMFWANHFTVSRANGREVAVAAGAFEREAIRPHVYGRFVDMLTAVESHPAMIWFLDNQESTGPRSHRNASGKFGLNENLAREILELHTLGVRTAYDQSDVTAFARVLTGWSVARAPAAGAQTGQFIYIANQHEPGPQTVMGKVYAENGVDQGKAVLRDLAAHPATAHHVATQLARHFVADSPPPQLVARLEACFRKTDGDLRAMAMTLVTAPEAREAPATKLRLPQEYLSAVQRSAGVRLEPQVIAGHLARMGQPLWQPGAPNGYNDAAQVWATPVSLEARITLANQVARHPQFNVDPRTFAAAQMGDRLSDDTGQAIGRAETRPQGIALALLSPEFMRR